MKKLIFILLMLFAVQATFSLAEQTIAIYQPNKEDVPEMLDLMENIGYQLSIETILKKIDIFTSDTSYKIWVARINDQIVGYLALHIITEFTDEKDAAKICGLGINPDFRRLGIGQLLVETAEDYAAQHNCSRIFSISKNHRAGAHSFYQKLGYVTDSTYFVKYLFPST